MSQPPTTLLWLQHLNTLGLSTHRPQQSAQSHDLPLSSPSPPTHSPTPNPPPAPGVATTMADLVAPSRSKRARSPSPAYGGDTLASPLEVLLKRRRRGEWTTSSGNAASTSRTSNGGSSMFVPPPPPPVWRPDPYSHHQHTSRNIEEGDDDAHASSSQAATSSPLRRRDDDDDMAESSTAWMRRAGVERRRQRAWEYLQNPATSSNVPNTASAPTTTAATHTQSHSQPETQMQMHMQMQIESSPAARYARARSASALHQPAQTPEPAATHPANMSSSPVRHRPPSSTPFRGDDEWTEDERMREWGAEYAAQNALLYSLVSQLLLRKVASLADIIFLAPRTSGRRPTHQRSTDTSVTSVQHPHHTAVQPLRPCPHTIPLRPAYSASYAGPRLKPIRVFPRPLLPGHCTTASGSCAFPSDARPRGRPCRIRRDQPSPRGTKRRTSPAPRCRQPRTRRRRQRSRPATCAHG